MHSGQFVFSQVMDHLPMKTFHELRPREGYPWFWSCPGDGPQAGCTDFLGGSSARSAASHGTTPNRRLDLMGEYLFRVASAARE